MPFVRILSRHHASNLRRDIMWGCTENQFWSGRGMFPVEQSIYIYNDKGKIPI